jgi:hypothetical protein
MMMMMMMMIKMDTAIEMGFYANGALSSESVT